VQNQLRRKGKLVVGFDDTLKTIILQWVHASPQGGHSGRDATLKRLKQLFYWKGMNKAVQRFIRQCTVCQTCKYDNSAYPGLLQPLPIPEEVWVISMDFIDGLPKSEGKEVILVVVYRFSKYVHFVALSYPYTTEIVAQAYLDNIYKLHGLPRSSVSDRDAIFLSSFRQSLFAVLGVDLLLSSSYHPQTDGQTEVLNRCLENYLRCMSVQNPKGWVNWLPMAEWWYNTTYQSAIQKTPFEVLYNQEPPLHLPYVPGESTHKGVDRTMQRREEMLRQVQLHLQKAQERMKQLADKGRSDRVFQLGDWVWLKLQAYRQMSVQHRTNVKLEPKYFGPFQVLDKIGPVAYKLNLAASAQIHPTVHVSQLKAFVGTLPTLPCIPAWLQGTDTIVPRRPVKILARKMVKRRNAAVVQYLVQWQGLSEDQASWEFAEEFERKYPEFEP